MGQCQPKGHIGRWAHVNITLLYLFTTLCIHFRQSSYTRQQLKSFKSLESYRYHEAGFVLELKQWYPKDKRFFLAKSRVKHGQSQNETPVKVWLATAQDGEILFGHCTCMAGLGEVCSHVGATLYHLEAHVTLIKERSCTSRPCQWVIPPSVKGVPYAAGSDINFKKPKLKCSQKRTSSSTCSTSSTSSETTTTSSRTPTYPPLNDDEQNNLYKLLAETGTKPAILSVIPKYSDNYVPISASLPPSLQTLYKPAHENLEPDKLKELCIETKSNITITEEQVDKIAANTINQSKSKIWYAQRAGRITASRARACVHTDVSNPAPSLIKSVCYPDVYKFTSQATKWGCDHEKLAIKMYESIQKQKHTNFAIKNTGLHISLSHPYIGASPDGITLCQCCGKNLVEVKCPFCTNDVTKVKYILPDKDTGITKLARDHAYYYQMQVQMFVLGAKSCDFVVYTEEKKDTCKVQGLYLEKIPYNQAFMGIFLPKAETFFLDAILPELLAKKTTRSLPVSQPGQASSNMCSICFCGQTDPSLPVLECSSDKCKIKVYHMLCLKYKRGPPKNKPWFCQTCKKEQKKASSE